MGIELCHISSASIMIIIWCFSLIMLSWKITLIDIRLLNQPWIPGCDIIRTTYLGVVFILFFIFEFYFFLYSRFLLVIYFIHISVYMSIPISQCIPPPPLPTFPPWCLYRCSLHLCLYFCLANRFTSTIFLHSTYMR